jgi:fructose-1,6-bisphosphatase I
MEQSRIAHSIGIALDRFIKNNQEQFQYASGELSQLLRDIALASKVVNREVNKAGLIDIMGALGSQNSAGDEQQKLDVLANIRFTRALSKGGEVCALISEESESYVDLNNEGRYVIAIDPLDGSSNIDVNVSIGTIFSVYRRKSPVGTPIAEIDILQKGSEQVASGYILYGSSTMLVYTTGHGVNGFTYEPTLGEYFLSHPDMKMPLDGKIFSVNEGSANTFPASVTPWPVVYTNMVEDPYRIYPEATCSLPFCKISISAMGVPTGLFLRYTENIVPMETLTSILDDPSSGSMAITYRPSLLRST